MIPSGIRLHRVTVPILATFVLLLALPGPASGQSAAIPTTVTVRAVSHDAKIIGSNVGGAYVIIRDARDGTVLAQGNQEGSTGNTTRIMVTPAHRDSVRYATEGAAAFVATLELHEPTFVDIEAVAPLNTPSTRARASKRMLLVPGENVLGEGIILELNGFTVELTEATAASRSLTVGARVTMLCGCPTEPGGMWDSNRIEVFAHLESGGRLLQKKKMNYAGRTSEYAAVFDSVPSGVYDLRIVASDADRANFGMTTGLAVVP